MREIVLFSAISVDGFIAKPDGGLDWLYAFDKTNNEADGIFREFYDTIDTTFIGRKTYAQIRASGHPDPYPEKKNFVFSRSVREEPGPVTYVGGDIDGFVDSLRQAPGKPIWLVGGGELNGCFLTRGYIDRIILDTIPVVLGNGIPLFRGTDGCRRLRCEGVTRFPSGRVHTAFRLDG